MLIDLKNKVVIVTGAGRGIGAEICRTFAREGAITIALDIGQDDLDSMGAWFESTGARGAQYLVDVRDGDRVNEVVGKVVQEFGTIDVLVNNAGVAGNGVTDSLDDESWDRVFDTNVKGVFHMCKAVMPIMKEKRTGRIINSSSFAAIVPRVGGSLYAASKAALTQYTRALAGELGPWNITVNSYAPGMVPTALGRFTEMEPAAQEEFLDTLTLRRWGDPSEVADVVCFLASDLARYITGTLIDISGGKLVTQRPRLAYDLVDDNSPVL
jgi:3-oxoacyl-[acyl-carrier protein] reductase